MRELRDLGGVVETHLLVASQLLPNFAALPSLVISPPPKRFHPVVLFSPSLSRPGLVNVLEELAGLTSVEPKVAIVQSIANASTLAGELEIPVFNLTNRWRRLYRIEFNKLARALGLPTA